MVKNDQKCAGGTTNRTIPPIDTYTFYQKILPTHPTFRFPDRQDPPKVTLLKQFLLSNHRPTHPTFQAKTHPPKIPKSGNLEFATPPYGSYGIENIINAV